MTSFSRPRYTLLVPTYNRPAYLRSLLGYLAARHFEYPIQILDSSGEQALSENRETISRVEINVIHQIYEPATDVHDKFARGAQSVETPYCSFCADDDVLFTRNLDELLDFLDANSEFVAAHGYYVNFKADSDFTIADTFYSAPSVIGGDALERIVRQMRRYQAVFYAVYRTNVMQFALSQRGRVQSLLARELLASSLTMVAGSVHRMQKFYMGRNIDPSIATAGWHPQQFLATDPKSLFTEYAAYRKVVLEELKADARCRARYQQGRIKRILDLAHLDYLLPMLSPRFIDYVLGEALRADREAHDVVSHVWNKFVNPPSDRAAGTLAHLKRALSSPGYAVKIFNYLKHFFILFNALRLRKHNLGVSFDRGLDRMWVERTTRRGDQRRYALRREFLNHELLGGRRAAASDIDYILEHLDDYV